MHNRRNLSGSDLKASSGPRLDLRPAAHPPQTDEADPADLGADLLEGREQVAGDLAPPPPVVADVEDVELLGRRRRGRRLQRRLYP